MTIDLDMVAKVTVAVMKALQESEQPVAPVKQRIEKDVTATGLSKTSTRYQKMVAYGIERHKGNVSAYCKAAGFNFTVYQGVMKGSAQLRASSKQKILAYDKKLRSSDDTALASKP